jgi:hypothetical protein
MPSMLFGKEDTKSLFTVSRRVLHCYVDSDAFDLDGFVVCVLRRISVRHHGLELRGSGRCLRVSATWHDFGFCVFEMILNLKSLA